MKERFFRNRTAVFTVVFVLLVGLVGILAPVIAPNDPYETNILNKFASYSLQYPLGTASYYVAGDAPVRQPPLR